MASCCFFRNDNPIKSQWAYHESLLCISAAWSFESQCGGEDKTSDGESKDLCYTLEFISSVTLGELLTLSWPQFFHL